MRRAARSAAFILAGVGLVLAGAGALVLILAIREDRIRSRAPILSPYPDGLDFAFTIVDDTDIGTLESLRPIYDLLDALGFRVTKTVWVFDGDRSVYIQTDNNGDTLERPEYRDFILAMHGRGHEIALHTVAPGTDDRARTIAGYERFREIFGAYPRMNIMHSADGENLYWGERGAPPSALHAFHDPWLDALWQRLRPSPPPPAPPGRFAGHDPASPLFWGDICRERTTYVRGPVTSDIDTLRAFPEIPYRDPARPYVRYWFAGSTAEHGRVFPSLIAREDVLRLERDRGACIVYTHFGQWFYTVRDGRWVPLPSLEENLRFLASRPGWFVPASTLLDRIRAARETFVAEAGDRILIANRSELDLPGATLLVPPGTAYEDPTGGRLLANEQGELLIGDLARGAEAILRAIDPPPRKPLHFRDAHRLRFLLDLERLAAELRERLPIAAAGALSIAAAILLVIALRRRRRSSRIERATEA